MKKIITLLVFFICYYVNGQRPNRVLFTYDDAGNQIERELCINCSTGKNGEPSTKEKNIIAENFDEKNLLTFFDEDVISYYPNPVKEELFLKWELINNNKVSNIDVYTIGGQLIKSVKKLEDENTRTISFQEYSAGTYLVLLFYTNGDQKSITIIKE